MTHTEWVAPCGCAYHPEGDQGPHVHACAAHADSIDADAREATGEIEQQLEDALDGLVTASVYAKDVERDRDRARDAADNMKGLLRAQAESRFGVCDEIAGDVAELFGEGKDEFRVQVHVKLHDDGWHATVVGDGVLEWDYTGLSKESATEAMCELLEAVRFRDE